MPTHRERIMACLQKDASLDHAPVALWRHFPVDDQDPGKLAAATLDYQKHFDFDLVKVTPASSFCLKDWGAVDEWHGHTEGTRQYSRRVIQSPGDWEKLTVLDPLSSRYLSEQLACLRMIRSSLSVETPLLQTVFSPLSQAKNLAGSEVLVDHLRHHPEAVLKGLKTILKTTHLFIEAAGETGIDGIFYAIQHAREEALTTEEYRDFGLDDDIQLIQTPARMWCNMVHLHGFQVYFDLVVSSLTKNELSPIINWHDRETPPSLKDAQEKYEGVLCGGLNQNTLVYREDSFVEDEAQDAIRQTAGKRFILGTGCVVPVIAPYGNIRAAIDIVRNKGN